MRKGKTVMINKLKKIQYSLRDVEKYLYGITSYENMQFHHDICNNKKERVQEYIDLLVDIQNELRYTIDTLWHNILKEGKE